MTTENASSELRSTNKRVRFEAPTSALNVSPSIQSTSPNQSPKGLALALISTFTVTLRRHLSPIVKKCGESNLDLLHNLITKMNQYSKLDDEKDTLPRSVTRLVNFDFKVTKKVENNPEFLVIKADTEIIVQEFKLKLKQKVMHTLQLTCRMLRDELYENLCVNLHLVTQAQLISDQSNLDPHKVISTILHYHFEELFDYTDITLEKLHEKYKVTHALPVFPFPIAGPNTPNPVPADAEPEMLPIEANNPNPNAATDDGQQQAIANRDACNPSRLLILGVFTRPGTAYFDRADAIKVDISLKKLLTTNTLEDATEATKERLDAETSVDSELLEEIVRKGVAAKTKNINSELGQLKKQLAELTKATKGKGTPSATKKSGRGLPSQKGASTRKKKSTPRAPKQDARAAAVPAKGTSRKQSGKNEKGEKKKKKQHKKK